MPIVNRCKAEDRLMAESVRRRRAAQLNGHDVLVLYQSRATMVTLLSICRGCIDGSLLAYIADEGGRYELYSARLTLRHEDWDKLNEELNASLAMLEHNNGRE